jgi:2-(1,2-epoxy-1,2-dihydrophenyl)acetyl-CoA isomerase
MGPLSCRSVTIKGKNMGSESVIETGRVGRVGVFKMVDERGRNSLTNDLRAGLAAALGTMAEDPDVRALYITGQGTAFCAGGNLRMMEDEGDPWWSHQRMTRAAGWLKNLLFYPKPVVIGVNGAAVGGGLGIALAGDVVYAAENGAKFMSGFMRIGLIPDLGVLYTLPRLIGLARAKAFLLGAENWNAQQAAEAGLIAGTVPDEQLERHCLERAEAMAAGPLEAFGLAKTLLSRSYESGFDEMITYEVLGQCLAYSTEAMHEGLATLLGHRAPDFTAASEREKATQAARRGRG